MMKNFKCTKIMVWAIGTISAGEISIATKFVEGLSDDFFDVLYLLPDHYSNVLPKDTHYTSLNPSDGVQVNKRKIGSTVAEFAPDFFFLSDPFTVHFASSWSGYSFSDIKDFQIPIIGLDEYGSFEFKRRKDYYGGLFVNERDLIDECDYVLQDVPVNLAMSSEDERVWKYSLFQEDDFGFKRKSIYRRLINEKFGIDEEAKLIMLPISSWESVNMNRLPILEGFIENLVNLVLFYLNELNLSQQICLLHVGKQNITYSSSETVLYKNVSSMCSELYEKCIIASDIFMTFNAVSVSLSRAVLNRVPSILMVNEKVLNFDNFGATLKKLPDGYANIVRDIHIAYPFYASTFGWYKFLKPLISSNSYFQLFSTVPVFSYSRMRESICTLLEPNNDFSDKSEKFNSFVDSILELKTPKEIMLEICERQEMLNETI